MRLVPYLDVTRLGKPLQEGNIDVVSCSYWRIINCELVPVSDPTYSPVDGLLMVDAYGVWKLAHAPDTSTGSLRFGKYSYAYMHDESRLGAEANSLLELLVKAGVSHVTKSEYLTLQQSIPQVVMEAKELPPPRNRKKKTETGVLVSFYWSPKIVPRFVFESMAQLYYGPVVQTILHEPLEKVSSAWPNLVHAYAQEYYDSKTAGKKDPKVHTGKLYGVKMKQ
jgi:hypothetical protein